jgi:hypothetical protein
LLSAGLLDQIADIYPYPPRLESLADSMIGDFSIFQYAPVEFYSDISLSFLPWKNDEANLMGSGKFSFSHTLKGFFFFKF